MHLSGSYVGQARRAPSHPTRAATDKTGSPRPASGVC